MNSWRLIAISLLWVCRFAVGQHGVATLCNPVLNTVPEEAVAVLPLTPENPVVLTPDLAHQDALVKSVVAQIERFGEAIGIPASSDVTGRAKSAVLDIYSNAVKDGSQNRTRPVHVSVHTEGTEFSVTISDESGFFFNPRDMTQPGNLHRNRGEPGFDPIELMDRRLANGIAVDRGGLGGNGILMVEKSLTDRATYTPNVRDGVVIGTSVTMVWDLAKPKKP